EQTEPPVEWGTLSLNTNETPPTISLDNVHFQYGDGKCALENIDATFPPYSQIAIVGPSGAGKTTLLQILSGLIAPTTGRVKINHEALETYQEEQWFQELTYISQHPYIFSGTIAENIAISAPEGSSHAAIMHAAERAGLGCLIDSLHQGLDTIVGEAGRGLSGGEKQR